MGRFQAGWSLSELMAVLAVSALLTLAVIPSLQAVRHQLQVDQTTQEFVSWMAMARSESIKRRRGRVVMCVAQSAAACHARGDWSQGWLMFHDLNGNARVDPGDVVIRYQAGLAPGLSVTGNVQVARYLSYAPSGRALLVSGGFQAGTITFCQLKSDTRGWQVVLSGVGRARMVRSPPGAC